MSNGLLSSLYQNVKETKEALFRVEGKLIDGIPIGFAATDSLKKNGLIPQCAGIYGLLLLYKTFHQDKALFSDEDVSKIQQLTIDVMKMLDEIIKKDGYNAAPYLPSNITEQWFGPEKEKYIGSVTWMLSFSLIIRYLHRKQYTINFEPIIKLADYYIVDGLSTICNSQIKISDGVGAWGFGSQADQVSLYFSYTVSASLNDFYDYVYEENLMIEDASKAEPDVYMIRLLQERDCNAFGYKNLEDAIKAVRANLQMWVIKYVLPMMPRYAEGKLPEGIPNECGVVSLGTSEKRSLGIDNNMNYNYIYYALFSFDMIITSCANLRFNDILHNDTALFDEIGQFYRDNHLLPEVDISLGFEFLDNKQNICELLLEETIHSIRSTFSKIIRTGAEYWETEESAFTIPLKYLDSKNNAIFTKAISNYKNKLQDSVMMPLYFRVNTLYCYWIAKEDDRILTDVYKNIMNDRNNDAEEKYYQLWDYVGYNILITEKAIESIIDYYLYILKFNLDDSFVTAKAVESGSEKNVYITKEVMVQKSPEEMMAEAVKQSIKAYMESEEGKALIQQAAIEKLGHMPNSTKTAAKQQEFDFAKALSNIDRSLEDFDAFTNEDSNYQPARNMIDLFDNLIKGHMYKTIIEKIEKEKKIKKAKIDSEDIKIAKERSILYINQLRLLLNRMGEDLEKDSASLTGYYSKIKELTTNTSEGRDK